MPWETKTLLDLLGRVSNTQHLARPIKCCRSKFPQPYFRGRAVAFEAAAFAKMHPLRSGFILVGGFFFFLSALVVASAENHNFFLGPH